MSEEQLNEIANAVDRVVIEGDKAAESTANNSASSSSNSSSSQPVDIKNLSNEQVIRYLQEQDILRQKHKYERFMGKLETPKEHKFWNTQPVLALDQEVTENGPINDTMTVDQVRAEPYNMPQGFAWCSIDVTDPAEILEMYTLLNENYVEDDECMFRFDYSIPFLQWALTQPGYIKDWHVGVRNIKTGALMGCITAVPVDVRVYDQQRNMAEINFLCVHKKLRTKRLAPVLIKEITRRVNVTNRWQAVYTAGVVLPKPVGRCRYYHRSLNPKKLIEIRFSSLPPKTTMASHLRSLRLPNKPTNPGIRQMTPEDVPGVHKLLNEYLSKQAKLCQVWSLEDVAHNLLPRKEVVSSYVIADEQGKITDLCSFYYLPSSVIGNPLHNKLNAVYSYYNVATTITVEDLFRDLLILARNEGADVFNALDAMENRPVFDSLKFGAGDGWLQYYLYNWKCPSMQPNEIGLILL